MEGWSETRSRTNGFRIREYFWLDEFRCRCAEKDGLEIQDGFCGGAVKLHPQLAEVLDEIRSRYGETYISSGFRCWLHHNHIYIVELGYEKENVPQRSSHLYGTGCDPRTENPIVFVEDESWLKAQGITGVGVKNGIVTHIDIEHAEWTVWYYD